jgi:hypothetical protein
MEAVICNACAAVNNSPSAVFAVAQGCSDNPCMQVTVPDPLPAAHRERYYVVLYRYECTAKWNPRLVGVPALSVVSMNTPFAVPARPTTETWPGADTPTLPERPTVAM